MIDIRESLTHHFIVRDIELIWDRDLRDNNKSVRKRTIHSRAIDVCGSLSDVDTENFFLFAADFDLRQAPVVEGDILVAVDVAYSS